MDDNTPDTVKRSRISIDSSQRYVFKKTSQKKSAGQKTTTSPNRNKMAYDVT